MEALYEYDNSLLTLKTTPGRKSVLHVAVKSRSVTAVKFVLSKDPGLVNSVDDVLQNPVHYAAGLQSRTLELLILNGADTTLTLVVKYVKSRCWGRLYKRLPTPHRTKF